MVFLRRLDDLWETGELPQQFEEIASWPGTSTVARSIFVRRTES
ncbi:hypothetical protein ACFYO9_01710 [Streptomyces sp. NPDC005863]